MSRDTIRYAFLLMALLIIAAYFVGVATDLNALSNGLNKLVLSITGRNQQGQFGGYPQGAPLGGTVQ